MFVVTMAYLLFDVDLCGIEFIKIYIVRNQT